MVSRYRTISASLASPLHRALEVGSSINHQCFIGATINKQYLFTFHVSSIGEILSHPSFNIWLDYAASLRILFGCRGMMLFHNMLALLLVISLATDRYSFAVAQIVQVRQAIIPKQPPKNVCSYFMSKLLYTRSLCPPALSLLLTNAKYMFISVIYLLLHYS